MFSTCPELLSAVTFRTVASVCVKTVSGSASDRQPRNASGDQFRARQSNGNQKFPCAPPPSVKINFTLEGLLKFLITFFIYLVCIYYGVLVEVRGRLVGTVWGLGYKLKP